MTTSNHQSEEIRPVPEGVQDALGIENLAAVVAIDLNGEETIFHANGRKVREAGEAPLTLTGVKGDIWISPGDIQWVCYKYNPQCMFIRSGRKYYEWREVC
jgi:hypothetical protein